MCLQRMPDREFREGLKEIEMSLPLILETRQTVLDAIEKQKGETSP